MDHNPRPQSVLPIKHEASESRESQCSFHDVGRQELLTRNHMCNLFSSDSTSEF